MRLSTIHVKALRLSCIGTMVLMLPTALVGQAVAPPVTVVGYFTKMRFTEEHAYGYSAELWRQGDSLVGLFLVSEGLQGDTPTGLLEDVKFDAKSGKISFRARLSIGLVYSREHSGVPSRDVFEFSGTLEKDRLAGTLKRFDALRPQDPPQSEWVTLQKSKSSQGMESFRSLDDWKKAADEILKYRGPKWR